MTFDDIEMIIFDCDGVLVDSEPIACGAVALGLRQLGIEISVQDVLSRYTGISAPVMYADIAKRFGREVSHEQQRAIDKSVQNLLASNVEAMPGVTQVLSELEKRYKLCVASSSAPSRISASLDRAGLAAFFGQNIFSAHQVVRGKPFPDLFLNAASVMRVAATRCVVIEDSTAGVTAAQAAGMCCFGFTGGGHATPQLEQALRDCGAEYVFKDMKNLPVLLKASR
jgi:HAD superfamily hydrolase (TIGR01509 family)